MAVAIQRRRCGRTTTPMAGAPRRGRMPKRPRSDSRPPTGCRFPPLLLRTTAMADETAANYVHTRPLTEAELANMLGEWAKSLEIAAEAGPSSRAFYNEHLGLL